jgi:endonuclease/exonuclease/phosphatase family metal-dependent hydrolase
MISPQTVVTQTRARAESLELETGSYRDAAIPFARSKLVIASYNIRYAVGSFLISGSLLRRAGLSWPGRRPALVERHLRRAALAFTDGKRLPPADIVALQEADKATRRAGGHDIARELAAALKMDYASALTNLPRDAEPHAKQWYLDFEEHIPPTDAGDTGIALLSRLPLTTAERVALPWTECAWRPRLALSATIQAGAVRLHLFNSHIDPHAAIAEQLAQHEAVLKRAAELSGPVILLGDFNTLSRNSCVEMRRLLESHGYSTPLPTSAKTWRAGLIRLHTDWIFTRGLEVVRWGVARGLGVSDHWPVWVEVNLNTAAQTSS